MWGRANVCVSYVWFKRNGFLVFFVQTLVVGGAEGRRKGCEPPPRGQGEGARERVVVQMLCSKRGGSLPWLMSLMPRCKRLMWPTYRRPNECIFGVLFSLPW